MELVFAFSGRAKQGPSCIAEDTTHFVVSVVHFSDAEPFAAGTRPGAEKRSCADLGSSPNLPQSSFCPHRRISDGVK
jgi:hypothetical protein